MVLVWPKHRTHGIISPLRQEVECKRRAWSRYNILVFPPARRRRLSLGRAAIRWTCLQGPAMPTPALSDITTHGIRVGATAFFLPEESLPSDRRFLFGYRIVIVNEGTA